MVFGSAVAGLAETAKEDDLRERHTGFFKLKVLTTLIIFLLCD